ncbi:hypothetical protein [Phormidesmis priestleyi]
MPVNVDIFVFILKVLVLSLGISLLIKYAGPLVAIAPTIPTVLALILSPSLILMFILLIRQQRSNV